MRDGTQLIREFLYKADTFFDCLRGTGRELCIFGRQRSQVHAQCSQQLSRAVVQLARDAPSLLVLSLQQLTRKCAQGLFRALALSNVADGARYDKAFVCLSWAQADFDRNLMTVFVKPVEFQVRAHSPHARFEKKTLSMLQVRAAETLRHQHLYFATQQFFP